MATVAFIGVYRGKYEVAKDYRRGDWVDGTSWPFRTMPCRK